MEEPQEKHELSDEQREEVKKSVEKAVRNLGDDGGSIVLEGNVEEYVKIPEKVLDEMAENSKPDISWYEAGDDFSSELEEGKDRFVTIYESSTKGVGVRQQALSVGKGIVLKLETRIGDHYQMETEYLPDSALKKNEDGTYTIVKEPK